MYVFVGIPGVDKSRLTNETKAKYPSFSVPCSWSKMTKIPDDRRIDVTSVINDANVFSAGVNHETEGDDEAFDDMEICTIDNNIDESRINQMDVNSDDDFIRYVL